MPIITIEASRSLSKEDKKKLIEKTSNSLANSLNLPVNAITVIIYENIPDNIGDGGKQVSSI